jgi:SAM-dependent methyltransferase
MSDAKQRFSDRVDAYVAARPRYPRAVVEHLRSAIGLTSEWTIADIGSGTGISTELFLNNGNSVHAVEPNGPMRLAAEQALRGFAGFKSVNGSAEATTLADQSVDLIVAAQAFHWFNNAAARAEFTRILRPGGYVLLMWNDRQLGGTEFLEAYESLLLTFGTDYLKIRHNNIGDAEITSFFNAGGLQSAGFPNEQHLDFEALRNRLLSSSYVPRNDQRMLEHLREIFERHNQNGRVTIVYQTRLYYGRLTDA